MKTLFAVFFSIIALSASSQADMRPISSSILQQLQGDWEAVGYGKFLSIQNGKLREYHRNAHGCIDTADQSQAQLKLDYAYIDIIDDNSFLASPLPFGNRWRFTRTTPLANCQQRSGANALETFDYFVAYLRQHYAYFEPRGMDWETRSAAVRLTLNHNSSDARLYHAMDGLLQELGDPHTGIYAILGGELVHRLGVYPRKAMPLIKAGHPSTADEDRLFLDWIVGQLMELESAMKTHGSIIETTPFYWAQFEDIGYLHIGSEGGFATSGKLQDEISAVETALDQALTDLADSRAVIVDLSLNLGGYEWISQTIARRFAREPVFVHRKTLHNAPEEPALDFVLEPSERPSYHGPLYLLTSDITVSAGEDLTLSLRALPQTRHYGLATYGALSNVLSKPLPNGWGLTLSNEVYTDADGISWEAIGITPDFEYDLYQGGIEQSHFEKIKEFAAFVTQQQNREPSLRISKSPILALHVDQAEPGSVLVLKQSSDLLNWSDQLIWTYQEARTIPLTDFIAPLPDSVFFKIEKQDSANQ